MATNNKPFAEYPNQQIDGPLAALYSSSYNFSNLFYPRDLGSTARGHYINFYINVAENTKYLTSKNGPYKTGSGKIMTLNAGGRTAINQQNQASQFPTTSQTAQAALTVRKTKRITQAIALYMPESIQVSYNAEWQSDSLTEAQGGLGSVAETAYSTTANKTTSGSSPEIAKLIAKTTEALNITGPNSQDFALFTQGMAANPQLEVLFKGTQMRTFSFDFLFSPYDETEAQNVLNIIKQFKFHQAPEVSTDYIGRFFIPPSEFDIDFLFNGQINKNIHQIGTVVLTGMNVDYSPNGWSTFKNGMPTHIKLHLDFTETEIVTKQRVAQDNY
jgi:hypothetical protein